MNTLSTAGIARKATDWSAVLSLAMIVLGILGIFIPAVAGITLTVFVAWLLLFSGLAHFGFGWQRRMTGVLGWELLVGSIYILAGGYLLFHLAAALAVLSIALGLYLALEAVLEFVLGYRLHPLPGSGWLTLDGVVTMILAILVWRTWSAAWVAGVLIGISMLFSGISRLALSMAARRVVNKLP